MSANQCTATSKRSGVRCRKLISPFASTCRLHGGATPNAVAAAERRRVEQRARGILARDGVRTLAHPVVELVQLAAEAASYKDALGSLVADLDEVRYRARAGESVRGEIVEYGKALDRVGRLLVELARLDVDARFDRLNEATGRLMFDVVMAAGERLGFDMSSDAVRTVFAEETERLNALETVS